MSNKTITIQQGTGDDALEMTVQVTQEELDKMEEIRSKDPSAWEGRGLDLVKAARDVLEKDSYSGNKQAGFRFNWKLLLAVALGILVIVGTVILAENRKKNKEEVRSILEPCDVVCPTPKPSQPNEENMRKVYNRLLEFGSNGSYEQFVEFFEESEDNKKKVYEKLKDHGYPGTYKDFIEYVGYKKEDIYYENIGKVYQDAVDRGFKDDEVSFREFLARSKENRHRLFIKMKEIGMKANEREFLKYIGYEEDLLEEIDWQSVLNDFVATKESKPNLTKEEWFEKFPEFMNDEKLLQAAFDYDATIKSGKYSDENELRSKFPEFWPKTNIILSGDNIASLYNNLKQENLLTEGSEADFRAWLEIKSNRVYLYNELKNRNSISHNSIKEFDEWLGYTSISEKTDNDLKSYTSLTYNFTIQYDDKEFQLVEKQNKNSHCVMKLQSPNDEVKSILVSVWENSEFSSSYDTDFISSCQSVDEGMGKVINSAVKTKVDGVNALKSELIISPMGKSYYAAIYRIIHKKRMYMLNIYIPIEEYNKDKSYGDKCVNNFKFN